MSHMRVSLLWAAALTIIDLLINPLKNGKADMDAEPTKQKRQVKGMVLYNPPKSVHLILPVICSTDPAAINSRAL